MGSMLAIGLVSQTLDAGIDAVLVETDGKEATTVIAAHSASFTPAVQELVAEARAIAATMGIQGPDARIEEAGLIIISLFAEAARQVRFKAGVERATVKIVGFLGSLLVRADAGSVDWRLGDPGQLAAGADILVASGFSVLETTPCDPALVAIAAAQRVMLMPIHFPGQDAVSIDVANVGLFAPKGL